MTVTDADFAPAASGQNLGASGQNWNAYLQNIVQLQSMRLQAIAAPSLSTTGTGCIYFDTVAAKFQVSENGGAFTNLVGTAPPFTDASAIAKNSVTPSKLLQLSLVGITAANTRVWTAQDTSLTVAGIDVAQTFTANQTLAASLLVSGSHNIGATSAAWLNGYFTTAFALNVKVALSASSFATFWNLTLSAATQLDVLDNSNALMFRFISGGNHTTYRHIVPSANNTWDLGATGIAWRKVWTTDINVAGVVASNLVPTGSVDVGSSGSPWSHVYGTNVNAAAGLTVNSSNVLLGSAVATFYGNGSNFPTLALNDASTDPKVSFYSATIFKGSVHAGASAGSGIAIATDQGDAITCSGGAPNSPVSFQSGVTQLVASGGVCYMVVNQTVAPAVSAANTCRLYFDSTSKKLMLSENGGAYANVV